MWPDVGLKGMAGPCSDDWMSMEGIDVGSWASRRMWNGGWLRERVGERKEKMSVCHATSKMFGRGLCLMD
jgi:hypothetical protein